MKTAAPIGGGRAFSMGRLVLVLLGEGATASFGGGRSSHFHLVAGGRALGSAGGRLSSSWGSHLVASRLARVGAAAGAGFDSTRSGVAATGATARCFDCTGGGIATGSTAAGRGLAAGEEAHGRESDDGEELHWFILSEIGRAKHGPTTGLVGKVYAKTRPLGCRNPRFSPLESGDVLF